CLDALARRRNVDYASMRYTNDFRLLMASWIYDLGYPASARLMRERGHLARLLAGLPAGPKMDQVRSRIANDLDKLSKGIHPAAG
ncbi:MAG: HD family phosphohydrolase, partial [Desulfovibrionaceae bacterium]